MIGVFKALKLLFLLMKIHEIINPLVSPPDPVPIPTCTDLSFIITIINDNTIEIILQNILILTRPYLEFVDTEQIIEFGPVGDL